MKLLFAGLVLILVVGAHAQSQGFPGQAAGGADRTGPGDRTARVIRATSSQVRQNFHQDCEAGINRQINLELYASYIYVSMAGYFDRDDKALHNFAKFFRNQSHEKREHAEKLMKLQNNRGGRIFLHDIRKPVRDEWASGLEALEFALQLEKSINQSLLDLHQVAGEHNDPHMRVFIETHFLDEHVKSIKELADWVINLRCMGAPENGMAEYLFDKNTLLSLPKKIKIKSY